MRLGRGLEYGGNIKYEFTEQVAGQLKEKPARYSFAYQRIAGRWLIVLQHSTLRP